MSKSIEDIPQEAMLSHRELQAFWKAMNKPEHYGIADKDHDANCVIRRLVEHIQKLESK